MTPERIITASTITTGEKHDGKELINLIEKSKKNGIEVEAIIGDGAYSEKDNLNYCSENEIKNVSKLSKSVTHGNGKNKEEAHNQQMEYMQTNEFKELYSERYKIEAKNAELKNNYNYGNANACGKSGITIQGATTFFLANMKRIIKLNEEKNTNIG